LTFAAIFIKSVGSLGAFARAGKPDPSTITARTETEKCNRLKA
jgi:hypothetical protein